MVSYQVHLDGLLPVLLVVDTGVVDDDVQTSKLVHGLLEGICPHNKHQELVQDSGSGSDLDSLCCSSQSSTETQKQFFSTGALKTTNIKVIFKV